MKICACGCGLPVPPGDARRKYATEKCSMRAHMRRFRAKHGPSKSFHQLLHERVPYVALDVCAYCGESGGEFDHITPVPRRSQSLHDPENSWVNLTSACRPCNTSKRERSLLGFMLYRTMREQLLQAARAASLGRPETVVPLNVPSDQGVW